MRDFVRRSISALFDFGVVVASQFDSKTNTLRVDIMESGNKPIPNQELWGNAAVIYCPADPSSDAGQFTAMYIRRGDELVGIASRDTRWQRALNKGEVAVRGFGPNAAWVILKPDGSMVLESTAINLGSASPSDAVALASLVHSSISNMLAAGVGALGTQAFAAAKVVWDASYTTPLTGVASTVTKSD